jgi:hypothetical protein
MIYIIISHLLRYYAIYLTRLKSMPKAGLNSKSYKESCSIVKISEHKKTGLPNRTVEPASGHFSLDSSSTDFLNTEKTFGVSENSGSKQGRFKAIVVEKISYRVRIIGLQSKDFKDLYLYQLEPNFFHHLC